MKKIFSIALAATLLAAGCQKTEVIGLDDSKTGPAMTFSTEMKKITKAGEGIDETSNIGELPDGNANLQANGFKIWAFADYDLTVNSNNVDTGTRIYDNMNGIQVTYEPATESTPEYWNPGQEYYWPAENRNLMFFAVSAKDNSIPNVKPTHGIESPYGDQDFSKAKLVINDFAVDTQTPDNDLMVANFRKQNSSQNDKAVNLWFRHALTKVQFVFKTSTNPVDSEGDLIEGVSQVFVQKVEVKGLENKRRLVVDYVSDTTSEDYEAIDISDGASVAPIHLDWQPLDTPSTADFITTWPETESLFPDKFQEENATQERDAVEDDKKSLLLSNTEKIFATWLMIPQKLDDKLMKITYVINKRQFSAMFSLEGPTTGNRIEAWTENQYVKYNITLTPDKILFDAEVNPWHPDNTGGPGESLQN